MSARGSAGEKTEEIVPASNGLPEIVVVRSTRRRKTVSARLDPDGRLRLLVPARTSRAEILRHAATLAPRIASRARAREDARRSFASDEYLATRMRALAEQYLPELTTAQGHQPDSIRWVTNQSTRWGSATPTAGRIRISHVLRGAPEFVIDSVVFHELCHFVEANHGARFRALEQRYPRKAEAEAFLAGIVFAQSQ
ncbi:M48 family metallopeptidase [Rothia sp. LK2588]|uniref:YgjP-like metallopeptidase domain-containing protein n=1 Tax=Rothia sp. LK2588 TaxID=3114369 RepID=UPI0034CE971D